jgi:hypothetical protein
VVINAGVPAKRRSDIVESLKGCSESFVKAWKYKVIAVQNVQPLAQRPLDAAVEVGERAHVTRLAKEAYAVSGYSAYKRLGIIKGGSVVNYLDLHFLSTGILRQHTPERPLEIRHPVVNGEHNGPKRSPACLGRGSDCAWSVFRHQTSLSSETEFTASSMGRSARMEQGTRPHRVRIIE